VEDEIQIACVNHRFVETQRIDVIKYEKEKCKSGKNETGEEQDFFS
jgi:hypothetical protein